MSCMNQTIHLCEGKHHKVAGVDLLFLSLLGFPEGSSLKLIKSNKSRKTLGEEAWGINYPTLHDYTPLFF